MPSKRNGKKNLTSSKLNKIEERKTKESTLPQQGDADSVDHLQQELSCRLVNTCTLASADLQFLINHVMDFRSKCVKTLLSRHISVQSIRKRIHDHKYQRHWTLDKARGGRPSLKSWEKIVNDIASQLDCEEQHVHTGIAMLAPLQCIVMAEEYVEYFYRVMVLLSLEMHCAAVLLKARPSLNQLEVLFKTVCYLYTDRNENSHWVDVITEVINIRNKQRVSTYQGDCQLERDYECSDLVSFFRNPGYFAPGKT